MRVNKSVKFLGLIVLCIVIGSIGSIFTTPSIGTWYDSINKPSFTPPNWVFGPVWITLFTLMGIALYLVIEHGLKKKKIKTAVTIFGIQFFFNVLWSVLFFGLRQPLYAFIEIIALWIMIALTIITFYKIEKRAGLVLLPYLIWVSIATALNFYVWILN